MYKWLNWDLLFPIVIRKSHVPTARCNVPSSESRVPKFGCRVSGFGTRGSGHTKRQHNPTHKSGNMKQHCMQNMNIIVIQKSDVPTPTWFGTRGMGQIKIQHNPTHQSANTKQHCMQNMNMIVIRKSHVPTATCNVPSSESQTTETQVPDFGLRSLGFGALELGNHVRSQGIWDIGDQMFVFSVSFCVLCGVVLSSLVMSPEPRAPSPETRNPKFGTQDSVIRDSELGTLHVAVGTPVSNIECRVPGFGTRYPGTQECHVPSSTYGILRLTSKISCMQCCFVFPVLCIGLCCLLVCPEPRVPNPNTQHPKFGTRVSGTRRSGHCMWELGHQIFE
jgi:hypothetical protein